MRSYLWRILALVVIVSMMIPLAAVAEPTQAADRQPAAVSPGGVGARTDPMTKLDGELRDLAAKGGAEPVLVYILAKPGADLSKVVDVTEVRPFLDDELVVANVKPNQVLKMASNPDVVAAEVFHAIEAPGPLTPREDQQKMTREQVKELREKATAAKAAGPAGVTPRELNGKSTGAAPAGSNGGNQPQDWYGHSVIGADKAWAKGYTGEGVNIAIIDSGVDFGHPDLDGRQATYTSGPYAGWPIALDPRSMRQYYYNGVTSSDNYADWYDYSWYADVYNVIHCTQGMTATFGLNEETYTIDPAIVALSKSGEIRWGIHPDEQLADFVYDWIPFILLDTTTAGVYDTVIADLNFDYWFDGYDDVANKADPVLAQDLGSYVYTDTVVMTGTQYVPAWWFYAGGPPTWYMPWDTAATSMTLPAGSWIAALDHNAGPDATDGADGIADVSGGMVYYIADGVNPVPGMDYLYPGFGPANMPPIPFNGQLVAFMIGSYWAGGGDHGTLCASAAAAGGQIKGYFAPTGEWVQYDEADYTNFPLPASGDPADIMPWLRGAADGQVQGPAPDARIIALGDNYEVVNGMQGMYDSYTFLAYGVDGVPNSGDEFVQIASMSYGDGSVHNDGWDWESRLLSYYNQNYLPDTTFFASSGNGGYGYGTINSPQGNTTVSVGASSQYGASDVFGGALALGQLNDGDVSSFSGRGPDALGRPDPDVLANGAWGAGDIPLNLAPGYGAFFAWYVQDGNQAWQEWGGTSRAAPEAAGVMALVYDAYKQDTGSFPDFETARQILMSGADDQNHDVLMQGAGRVNADRATDVAGGLDGVYVTPSLLAAGEYDGTHYESFANVLYPGDTWSQTFTVSNPGAAAKTVTLGDEMLMQMEVLTYTQVVTPYGGMEDPYPDTYYYYANYFVGADPTTTTHGADMVIPVPDDADFMEVHLVVPFEIFDFSYQNPDPYSLSYAYNQRWSLTVYDWQDRNDDGVLWKDTNGDGIVNPQVDGDTVDVSYTGPTTMTEINRFNYSYNYANVQEVTVKLDEERKANDNIVVGLVHRNPNNTRPGWGAAEYQANPLLVKVVFYKKMDWGLVAPGTTSLAVPAGGSATFDADFTIPADQPPGLYEGAITVDDGTHMSIIPTTVNVAVPSDELLFTLGGTPKAGTPYDNGRMIGGYTWYSVLEEGDWRFYYYDAAAGFDQQYLYVQDQWGKLCSNMPTANETLVWNPNPGDQFSMMEPDKYGPYGVQYGGGTWDAYGPQNGWYSARRGDWWQNADGTALPETRVWASLWDGLNQVQLRNILLSGKHECGEGYEATAGVFGVDAPMSGIQIDANTASGSFAVDAVSPIDGLIAYASGFGQEQWFRNQDVPQGKHFESWPVDLMDGWVYTFDVTNTSGIELSTFGPASSDIDLYLLYDANGDGVFNPYDNREQIDYSYNAGSNEYISYWGNYNNGYMVQNGTYAVVMYGYYVQPGDQFDLRLVTYGGEDLNVEGANPDNNYVLSVTPGEKQNLLVNWQVPGPGVWNGYLWFAMPWEEEPTYWYQGSPIGVPVTINFKGVSPSVTKTVDKEQVCNNNEILTYNITVANAGGQDAYVEVADLLPEGVNYHEQYVGEADDPDYGNWYVAKWWYENGAHGYFWPDENDYIRWEGGVGPATSGSLYIEYQVKVKPGFAGTITNKADVTMDYDGYHQFMSDTAVTQAFNCVYLPIISKNQ
jgi:uncharacterized repeat protein (TIGR01451 family)